MKTVSDSVGFLTSDVVGHIGSVTYDNVQNCYDYWRKPYGPVVYGYNFCTHTSEDKGVKALSIIKTLMKKKIIKLNTIKDFVDVMDELVKIL